jgi:hypothetical protein
MPRKIFGASGSWQAPAGVTQVTVECWGPGGNGNAGPTGNPLTGGAGGGGGAYASSVVSVTPGNSYTITVGTGGSETDTSFESTVIADAGKNATLSGGNSADGGLGGTAASSTGTTKFSGGRGGNVTGSGVGRGGTGGGGAAGRSSNGTDAADRTTDGTTGLAVGLGGTGSEGGDGGGGGSTGAGFAGNNFGGGGGGAGTSNNTAGTGAGGLVILIWTTAEDGTTVTIQPDATAGKDTWLASNVADNNFGVNTQLVVGVGSSGETRRTLLQFDLSTIPANVTLLSAALHLYVEAAAGVQNIAVYRCLVAWDEGTGNNAAGDASWNQRQSGVNWSTAGANGSGTDRASSATVQINDPAVNTVVEANVLADVQAWYEGSATNNGWVLSYTETNNSRIKLFVSSDHPAPSVRPALVVLFASKGQKIRVGRGILRGVMRGAR